MISQNRLQEFWRWFSSEKGRLERLLEASDEIRLAKELSPRVKMLHEGLRWEIGPGKKSPYALTIWSGGNAELRAETDDIIKRAPSDTDWEFYSFRQAREIPEEIELNRRKLTTTDWMFTAVRNEDGRYDLKIFSEQLSELDESSALQAVFLYLDCALGEDAVEAFIGDIRFSRTPEVEAEPRKLSGIRKFLAFDAHP